MSSKNMLMKILGVIAGVVFVVYGFSERSSINRIKSTGKIAVVQPIKNYTKRKSVYTAEFTFVTERGETITKNQSFPEELVRDFEAKNPVNVVYNPSNPSEFVFEKQSASWFLVLSGIGIAIAALIFA